jgi:hypothetical protein
MVIVHPERRGQGIGGQLVDAALAGRRARVVGLDATELGAPIYERRGFVTVGHIDRWAGELQTAPANGRLDGARQAAPADIDSIARFDAALSGVDRAALIARLVGEPETAVVVAHAGVVNTWLAQLLGLDRPLVFPLDYTGITRVLAGRDGRRVVRTVNEIAHGVTRHGALRDASGRVPAPAGPSG